VASGKGNIEYRVSSVIVLFFLPSTLRDCRRVVPCSLRYDGMGRDAPAEYGIGEAAGQGEEYITLNIIDEALDAYQLRGGKK